VTGGEVAAAALQRKTIAAIVNVARVIAHCSYHFVIVLWSANEEESGALIMNLRSSKWISIGAVLIAAVSLVISFFAMRDARALSKLGIRPEIRIHADFDEKNHGNNPLLTVYNVSPIDIVQLELHAGMLHLSANSNEIELATTAPRVKVDRIAGNDAKVIPIAEFNASENLRLFQPAKPGELMQLPCY
jgi:hypothetical protein